MTIQDCADWVKTQLAAVTGIKGYSAFPVDRIEPLPYAFVAIGPTSYTAISSGYGRNLYSLRVFLLTQIGQGAVMGAQSLEGIPEAIAAKIFADPTMGGAASTFDTIEDGGWQPANFNGIDYGGYVLMITRIKLHTPI